MKIIRDFVIIPIVVASLFFLLVLAAIFLIGLFSTGTLPKIEADSPHLPKVFFLWIAIVVGLSLQKIFGSKRSG